VSAIREATGDGEELVAFILRVFRGQERKGTLRDRVAAATWLADRCFGRPFQAASVDPSPGEGDLGQQGGITVAALGRLSVNTLAELHEAYLAVQAAPPDR
jgi:hypothetical protein